MNPTNMEGRECKSLLLRFSHDLNFTWFGLIKHYPYAKELSVWNNNKKKVIEGFRSPLVCFPFYIVTCPVFA